ncbi:hypothetical protein J4419_04535 [Candidatus Woesearchaeota archaeon]|nr:hypothetical protein [Candidatus Woesearchaeota archaeon]
MARRLSLILLASALAGCGREASAPTVSVLQPPVEHSLEKVVQIPEASLEELRLSQRRIGDAVHTLTEAYETNVAEIAALKTDLAAYQNAKVPLAPSPENEGSYALPLVWSTMGYEGLLHKFVYDSWLEMGKVDDAYVRDIVKILNEALPKDIGAVYAIELRVPWNPLDPAPFGLMGNRTEICAAFLTRAGSPSAVVYKGEKTWLLTQDPSGGGIRSPFDDALTYRPVPFKGWQDFASTTEKTGSPLRVKVVTK